MGDTPDAPAATPADLDAAYEGLIRLFYQGIGTPAIKWSRKEDVAVAWFDYSHDAAQFVFGFLEGFPHRIIKSVDTGETAELRGKVKESFLPKRSLADQVKFPEQKMGWGLPMEIEIPLAIIDIEALQKVLANQAARGLIAGKPDAQGRKGSHLRAVNGA